MVVLGLGMVGTVVLPIIEVGLVIVEEVVFKVVKVFELVVLLIHLPLPDYATRFVIRLDTLLLTAFTTWIIHFRGDIHLHSSLQWLHMF